MLKNHKSACSFQTTAVCSNLCNFFSQILLITALLFKWTQWKPHLSSNKLKARSGLLGKEYKFHHEAKWVQAFSLKSLPLQGPVHVNEFQQVKRPKEDGQFSEETYKSWKQRELRSPFRKILEQMLFGKVHREVMGFSQQHTSNHRCLAGTEETSWVLKWARLSFNGLGRRKSFSLPIKSTDFGYTSSHIFNCNLKSMFIQQNEQSCSTCSWIWATIWCTWLTEPGTVTCSWGLQQHPWGNKRWNNPSD